MLNAFDVQFNGVYLAFLVSIVEGADCAAFDFCATVCEALCGIVVVVHIDI